MLILLAAAIAVATASPDPVSISAPLDLADRGSLTITVERSREGHQGGKVTSTPTVTTTYTGEIKASPDGGYFVRLLLGKSGPSDPAKAGLLLEFSADDTLRPLRMENWKKLRLILRDLLRADARTSGEDKTSLAETERLLVNRTPEQAAGLLLQDVARLSLAQGVALTIAKPEAFSEMTPSMLGGPPIQTDGATTLLSVNHDKAQAEVEVRFTLDPKSTMDSLQASVRAMAERTDPGGDRTKMEEGMRDMSLERIDVCRYVLDLRTGLARSMTCEIRVDVKAKGETSSRIEWINATQVYVPAP